MGSSAERKRLGDAVQARRAAKRSSITSTVGSGEIGVGGVSGGSVEGPSELVVPLVHVDHEVMTRSKVGDSVRLHEQGRTVAVLSAIGKLGEIPPGYLHKVQTGGYSGGTIAGLRAEPLDVKVSLS